MLMDVNKIKENVETKDHNVQCVLKREETSQEESLMSINTELNSKLNVAENELKQANGITHFRRERCDKYQTEIKQILIFCRVIGLEVEIR